MTNTHTSPTTSPAGDQDRYRPGPARDIAIEVTRSWDADYKWDGDGPDPELGGYLAYVVKVTAYQIINGRMYSGSEYLSGSYFKPEEPIADIHGYYPQMREEAYRELNKAIAQAENQP